MAALYVFVGIFFIAMIVIACVYGSKKSSSYHYHSSSHKTYATKPIVRPKKYTVYYITQSQYTSIKNQITKLIINKEDLQKAVDGFIGVKDDEHENITYQVVDDKDERSNYKYQGGGSFWSYCEPFDKIKFLFRDNGTRTSKRIIQYFNDENIHIYRLNKTECYALLDKTSIHVAYLDYITRFEETVELHQTFGWRFRCIRRNNRCKKIEDIIIRGSFHCVRPAENIYCKHVCAYRNNWQYDKTYVQPVQSAYQRVYTELALNGGIPVRFRGEKDLLNLLSTIYPDVIFQYHPDWLKPQSLDFFIPSLNVGIEFQGQEHYRPINDSNKAQIGFEKQLERDKRKQELCNRFNVKLILWEFDLPINKQNLNNKLNG